MNRLSVRLQSPEARNEHIKCEIARRSVQGLFGWGLCGFDAVQALSAEFDQLINYDQLVQQRNVSKKVAKCIAYTTECSDKR